MRLVFDSETSGLMRDDLPINDPAQPHLVQLGAQLFSPKWERVGILTCLIRPDGWSIEPEAQQVHGITEARCHRYGIDVRVALATFAQMTSKASILIAHHANFDRRVIDCQLAKIGAAGDWWKKKAGSIYCTMEASTEICKMPGEFGHKFPSLEEAHRFFYPDIPFNTRHDAERDVEACASIYQALNKETPDEFGALRRLA